MPNDHPPLPRCTECGGDRLTWRVKRDRLAIRDSRRTLQWTCAGCGHAWTEPLSLAFDRLSEPEPEPAG